VHPSIQHLSVKAYICGERRYQVVRVSRKGHTLRNYQELGFFVKVDVHHLRATRGI